MTNFKMVALQRTIVFEHYNNIISNLKLEIFTFLRLILRKKPFKINALQRNL